MVWECLGHVVLLLKAKTYLVQHNVFVLIHTEDHRVLSSSAESDGFGEVEVEPIRLKRLVRNEGYLRIQPPSFRCTSQHLMMATIASPALLDSSAVAGNPSFNFFPGTTARPETGPTTAHTAGGGSAGARGLLPRLCRLRAL